jgi:hypothetical protein
MIRFFSFINEVTTGKIRKADKNNVSSIKLYKAPKSDFWKNKGSKENYHRSPSKIVEEIASKRFHSCLEDFRRLSLKVIKGFLY